MCSNSRMIIKRKDGLNHLLLKNQWIQVIMRQLLHLIKEEMNFINWYKGKLFAMISDYNITHHEVEDTTASGEET